MRMYRLSFKNVNTWFRINILQVNTSNHSCQSIISNQSTEISYISFKFLITLMVLTCCGLISTKYEFAILEDGMLEIFLNFY